MNQLRLKRLYIFFITIVFYSFCGAMQQQMHNEDIVVFCNKTINAEIIEHYFSALVVVGALSFTSDVVFYKQEFFHLLGFKEKDEINAQHIIAALQRFEKKNKFFLIKMNISTGDDGIGLHFVFESEWTFKKIKIHNVYRGKHFFQQLYLMERGDVFDESKHNHSIVKIKEFLIHGGYFNAQVNSSFEYDHYTKEVIAHISIKKGACFVCNVIEVNVINEDTINDELYEDVRKALTKKLAHALVMQTCTKDLLNAQTHMLKDYLAKKGFLHSAIECTQDVDYDHALVRIQFTITIHQKREIVFFGHSFFSKKELLNKILDFGQSVWLLPASLLAEEIIREYKSKGFLNVEVAAKEEKDRSFFIIKEGPRAIIKAVEIKNGTISDDNAIKRCFKKLLKHGYFDTALYDEAISKVTNLYVEKGFLVFTVVDYECIATEVENEYILTIFVDEGIQKYITQVSVDGYPELMGQGPFKKNDVDNNKDLFEIKIVEEQRAWLVKHFQSLGYLHPRIKPIIEQHDENVSIRWTVETGEKVHFGKTIVLGSSSFPFSYLERFLFYQEGDLWNQDNIKRSFRALKDLEIFETIHFSADHSSASEDKPILLKLHLDDRYEIRTRAGLELQHVRKYQTFSGVTYKIGGTALIKNPTNSGDQLRFDCDFARSHREIVGKYRRPWFTDNPFFTTMQVYSIVYDQPGFIGSTNDIYTLIQNGFLVGVQKKARFFDVGWNNGCEWMKLHIKDDEELLSFAHAIDFKPQLIDKTVPFFFTEPTIMFERLNDALNPTQGGVSLFSLKMMLPLTKKYKDSFFFKILCEQSIFIPLKKIVTALRFRCGHVFYREFSGIMPSERFYLGGSHSLRGYEADLAPPLGVFVDDDGKEHVVPRGGKTMLNANIELRFPVWRKIGGVIFQDIGALSGTMFADFKAQDLLAATGFGVRVFTPLGPLRFDIGWRWRKQLAIERSFAWFLTFGQAF